GESIWLGHFLHWVLNEFAVVAGRKGDEDTARRYEGAARELKEAINAHGWDGEWYIRATCDDGTLLGSSKSKYGRIFLNAQTWAVMSGVADDSRVRAAMDAVKRHLSLACGPVLLAPAYQEPDEKIGYLTRYAPGVRENGGRYTHASCWAILAAAMMRDAQEAWRMYRNICSIHCGENPDLYKVEPYVTAGNADGPDSPNMGEGGWTWYTGSAAWLFRVCTDWLLGVRAEYDGLLVDPCIPPEWDGFTVRRTFRGAIYQIIVRNPDHVASGVSKVAVDGIPGRSNLLPPVGDGRVHDVEIILGRDQSQRG
ncbi:MAG: glycosyl transferase family 36, partial [Bacillota bacterium]